MRLIVSLLIEKRPLCASLSLYWVYTSLYASLLPYWVYTSLYASLPVYSGVWRKVLKSGNNFGEKGEQLCAKRLPFSLRRRNSAQRGLPAP